MLKLVKFEFLRKRMSFMLAAALIVLGQIYALYKYFSINDVIRDNFTEEILGIFLGALAVGLILLYLIDLIFLFRNDLFKQEGYMLFMTPNSGYKLLGGKLIFALLEGVAIAGIYLSIAFINLKIMGLESLNLSLLNLSTSEIIIVTKLLMLMVFMIIEFALTIYLSFALFKSLFSNNRFKGLITFGIFILINILKGKVADLASTVLNNTFETIHLSAERFTLLGMGTTLNIAIAATLISSVLMYLGTGYLLEKRINL